MTAPAAIVIGGVVAGKYRVERVLGKGGMGTVYLAENIDIGRKVALKVLHAALGRDDDIVKRFRQEARASATIAHGNIVDVLDMGITGESEDGRGGEAYIVMELLVGETLAARRERRGTLPVGEVAAILCEVLDGLAAAHAKGFVHRDLKPENIFLTWQPRWAVKILDFGISRVLGADELRVTASNVVMGSVLYMAPEQAKDARSAGAPADLYAIGAIAYQLLVGVPPFVGTNYAEVMAALLTDRAAPIGERAPAGANVPAELAACIDALLAKDPAKRPTASEVRAALAAAVGGALPAVVDERQANPPGAFAPGSVSDSAANRRRADRKEGRDGIPGFEAAAFDPLAETAVVPEPAGVGETVATTTGRPAASAIAVAPMAMPAVESQRAHADEPARRPRALLFAIGGVGVVAAIAALVIVLATRHTTITAAADAHAPVDARPVVLEPTPPPDAAPAPLDAAPLPIDAARRVAAKAVDAAPPPHVDAAAPPIDARGLLQLPDPDQPH